MLSQHKKIVLATNDTTTRDMARLALAGKYSLFAFPSAEKLMQYAERTLPDLILFGGGLDTLGMLRAGLATRDVPVIFLTDPGDLDSESEALALGAADCVQSTASPQLLQRRVDLQVSSIVQKYTNTSVCSNTCANAQIANMPTSANAPIANMPTSANMPSASLAAGASAADGRRPQNNALAALDAHMRQDAKYGPGFGIINARELALNMVVELVECRDGSTRGHIDRTERYMRVLAEGMASNGVYLDELSSLDTDMLCQASKLHDLGKVGIRDSILQKPGSLTIEEFEEMKTHTTLCEEVIDRLRQHVDESEFFSLARAFAGSHHERWDGKGYPRRLRGDGIPLAGRLMAIADVYDALVSERPYKPAYTHDMAVSLIIEESGRHFDPALVGVFASSAHRFASIWNNAAEVCQPLACSA